MAFDYELSERLQKQNEAKAKAWRFRAEFLHDVDLETNVWAVDGVHQDGELNEANLLAAVSREGTKPIVTVGAPLHLAVGKIIGFTPPYKHIMAAA